jgi:hypothetical protein
MTAPDDGRRRPRAADVLSAARPILAGVAPGRDAVGLQGRWLLHAGPPLGDPARPPTVLHNAIVATCLQEGWAAGPAQASALLRDGRLTLEPAQDHGCVTPLAAVIGPGTPLLRIADAAGEAVRYAPVSAVRGADTRMGALDPALAARLLHRDAVIAPALQRAIAKAGPPDLWPLATLGLVAGDDLHSRTTGATEALAAWCRQAGEGGLAEAIAATPLFFLTIWMGASALVLGSAEAADLPTLVTRAGGNAERFGIALAGRPGCWVTCDAVPPHGPLRADVPPGVAVAGAIGDSAVIDLLGFGGQRLVHAPEPLGVFRDHLPGEHAGLSALLGVAPQPLLPDAWPLGIDAARVRAHRASPLVMLAMLARDGVAGFVGRGIYRPPVQLFDQALDVLG